MILYTQGSYDIFHAGHVNFLERCAKFGDVVVGLLSDESFKEYRGYAPINKFEDRKRTLEGCIYVNEVIMTNNERTIDDIRLCNPDVIAIGTDWTEKNIYLQWNVSPEMIDDKLIYIPYTKNISSTRIKKLIRGEDVD